MKQQKDNQATQAMNDSFFGNFTGDNKQSAQNNYGESKSDCQKIDIIHNDNLFFRFNIKNSEKDSYDNSQDEENYNTLGNLFSDHISSLSLANKSDKYKKNRAATMPKNELMSLNNGGQTDTAWLTATPKNNPLATSQKKLESILSCGFDNSNIDYPQENYSAENNNLSNDSD